MRVSVQLHEKDGLAKNGPEGTENPRVGGSTPSLGTTSKPASVKGLRFFNSL